VQEAFAGGPVTGTATYRERIALPPDAVFEATLEATYSKASIEPGGRTDGVGPR